MVTAAVVNPWAVPLADPVRAQFEGPWFDRLLTQLIGQAPGDRVLDLFCGDARLSRVCAEGRYTGVDLFPPDDFPALRWDLRDGLGPAGERPFDVCIASFGAASHLMPVELGRLLDDVVAAAAPGALVAFEALGLHSIEWPALWTSSPGGERELEYQLAERVSVHPWLPVELRRLFARRGLRWVGALDRTVQAGPKLADYWPGQPAVRAGLALLAGGDPAGAEALCEPLPPLPAHPAAAAHHALATARRELVRRGGHGPRTLAGATWALEPRGAARGLGHGVVAVARVP